MKCPHCKKAIEIRTLEDEDSGLTITLEPKKGQMIHAETIGGVLKATAQLLRAVGKEKKVNCSTMVRSMKTNKSGKIEISLFIAKAGYKSDKRE